MRFLALEVQWVMGLPFWVILLLCWDSSGGCELSVRLTQFPRTISNERATVFSFEPLVDGKVEDCPNCNFSCKLDSGAPSDCPRRKALYDGLLDGNHSFEVCTNGSQGSGCASHIWTIDTIPPTACIKPSANLTSAPNVFVTILFSEPCTGGGGFRCSSVDACNLLVNGAGQVIPPSLRILQPNLKYTLSVSLNSTVEYGQVFLAMDENVCTDNAGNRFRRTSCSNISVQLDSKPIISSVASVTSNAALFTASLATGMLSVSTASLHATGAFTSTSATSTSNPSTDLFGMACHVQVFALSRRLAVELPVEYDELARDLQWSIPYFSLPWEVKHVQPPASSTSHFSDVLDLETVGTPKEEKLNQVGKRPKPFSLEVIKSFFEKENSTSEAADPQHNNGWNNFGRNMFWLVIIDGSLIFLHALLLLILTCKKKTTEKRGSYMALILPRLEMLLLIHALPCVSQASSALIQGGTPSEMVVGILLLGVVAFELLSVFLFLSVGITFGKLLQYKEVHQGGRRISWHRKLTREFLGPGENGQWTWKQNSDSVCWTIFGPLFEDLRGPPENMLSQIRGANPREDDRVTASDGGTEDAKVPLILKMFGILRIYYPLLECIKRVTLGIFAGTDWPGRYSRTPTIALSCVTSFQLLFLVLKKPFRNKKVQLVEITSVLAELGIFASSAVISSKKLSKEEETGVGIFMVVLFLIALAAQMVNMWDALYRQVKRLDPDGNSFQRGLKVAFLGVLYLLTPQKTGHGQESKLPEARPSGGETGDAGSSARRGLQETSSPTDE